MSQKPFAELAPNSWEFENEALMRKDAVDNSVDVRIARAAENAGVQTMGLETFAEQMDSLAKIPLSEDVA